MPDDGTMTAGDIRDKGGRLIRRKVAGRFQNLGYDGRNRLNRWDWDGSAGTSCTYDYDHAGRRILTHEIVGGVTKVTRYVYDGADVCAEYEDSDNDGGVDRTRVYWLLPGMDRRIGFAETVGDTTTFYYYLTDHVGTVLRIVREDGTVVNQYDYDAFGRVRWASDNTFEGVGNRYLFQGREWDRNGGFYYFRNRIYLPERGEFSSPDMNLGRGILGELDGMATLTFCGGDPVNCVDPTGLIAYDLCSPYAVGQYAAAERRGETYDPFALTKVYTELCREVLSDPVEREGFLLGMKVNTLMYCGSLTGPIALSSKLHWCSKLLIGGVSEGSQWFITDNGIDRLSGKTPDYGANSVEALQVAGTSFVLRGLVFGVVKAYQSLQKTVGGLMDAHGFFF